MKKVNFIMITIITITTLLYSPLIARADYVDQNKEGNKYFYTSLFTHHWNYNPEHNNQQDLIGLEYYFQDDEFYGMAYFQNSFHQPCYSLYLGKYYNIYQNNNYRIRGRVLAGVIHGYDDEDGRYDGILNKLGTFPFVAPQIGVEYNGMILDIIPLANAGVMVSLGVEF